MRTVSVYIIPEMHVFDSPHGKRHRPTTYNVCLCGLTTGMTDSNIPFTTLYKCFNFFITQHAIKWEEGALAKVIQYVFFIIQLHLIKKKKNKLLEFFICCG